MHKRNDPSPSVAVLFQALPPPLIDGVAKPLKPGGYKDSGADIAFALRSVGVPVVTPAEAPDPNCESDWVFPDTVAGISAARAAGARILWANTVLFTEHPITQPLSEGLSVVGQPPAAAQSYDDKWRTNAMLGAAGCPTVPGVLVGLPADAQCMALDALDEGSLATRSVYFPCVVKPVRGRGSDGVTRVQNVEGVRRAARDLLSAEVRDEKGRAVPKYGNAVIVERYLVGEEVTVTVMPPGRYERGGRTGTEADFWCLPLVRRFNHVGGVAPYNGVVAVTQNSVVVDAKVAAKPNYAALRAACVQAAQLVQARAPIRIDCRADEDGIYYLFDLNMKPNMTGPGRPGRDDQDSLTGMAARAIGWSYPELLRNILRQFE